MELENCRNLRNALSLTPVAPISRFSLQTEASIASLVLNSTSLVTVFGTLFGSGVGGGGANHTMTAVRALGPASRNCVPVVAGPGLDVSYRVLGDMQRHQPELLVDSAYTVPGDPAQWVHTSAYVNTC